MRSHLPVMFVEDQSSHTRSNMVDCASAVKNAFGKKCIEIFNPKDKSEYNYLSHHVFIINVSAHVKLFCADEIRFH